MVFFILRKEFKVSWVVPFLCVHKMPEVGTQQLRVFVIFHLKVINYMADEHGETPNIVHRF